MLDLIIKRMRTFMRYEHSQSHKLIIGDTVVASIELEAGQDGDGDGNPDITARATLGGNEVLNSRINLDGIDDMQGALERAVGEAKKAIGIGG